MVSSGNTAWNLEAFLDSLILELDKAQDTLSVKGVNRKLTYTVKDLSLDLQIFPEFDGDTVRFTTAKPGDTGASKVSIQLGSIRDNQIKEISRTPTKDDISLDVAEITPEEKKELKKLGIHSAEDLRRTVEERNVDLDRVTESKVNYQKLANLINHSRRKQLPPQVSKVSVSRAQGQTVLTIQGSNLAMAQAAQFPVAVLNDEPVKVVAANAEELQVYVRPDQLEAASKQLKVALDPYAIITMELKV